MCTNHPGDVPITTSNSACMKKKKPENDFYCTQVLSGTLEVDIVYESDLVLAFFHTQPYFEQHIVIISKQHIASLSAPEATEATLAHEFLKAIHQIVSMLERDHGGCRVCSNIGDYQSTRHLHWYVHAGRRLRDEAGRTIGVE